MADIVHDDVVEQILIELDVKDLIRCKSVCKSWYYLITSSRFINRHLNLSYNKDRYNNNLGHRRVSVFKHSSFADPYLVGSSNGLVCIFFCSGYKLIVGNPLTREVRQLAYPTGEPLCWGFGYDSSTEDYKVIVGVRKGENQTCFRILSLKSNAWRDVGEENYNSFMGQRVGILYNGALHWFVQHQNMKTLIISFALSREEFKEIPQPDYDARYKRAWRTQLAIMKECLCIVGYFGDTWLMKKYNVKESWELVEIPYDDTKYDILHTLRLGYPFVDVPEPDRTLKHRCWRYMLTPIFVQSLVSPHVSEVAKEPETAETVSDLTEKVDLGEPNEQIQEVVKESVAVLSERKNLGGPVWKYNQTSLWFSKMKLQSTLRSMIRRRRHLMVRSSRVPFVCCFRVNAGK